jgi:hypothetical protein
MSKRKKRAPRKQLAGPPALLLVSYVPLLRGQAGTAHDLHRDEGPPGPSPPCSIRPPPGRAAACLWVLDGQGSPVPVLALERAPAVAGHLTEWAGNEPARWFMVYPRSGATGKGGTRPGRYCLPIRWKRKSKRSRAAGRPCAGCFLVSACTGKQAWYRQRS